MKYYLAMETNEKLVHATTWINLENTLQSETNQTQKATYCVIPFIGNFQNWQIYKGRKQISGSSRAKENEELEKVMRCGVSLGNDEIAPELNREMIAQTYKYIKNH